MLAHSPSITLPGIVLCLDASNPRCYSSGSTGVDLISGLTLSNNGINVSTYTPSSGGSAVKAWVFPNAGSVYPTLPNSSIYNFRTSISWDFVACKENDSNRQSVWSQMNTSSPWDGMGLVSLSHDSTGQLAWWTGNYSTSGNWWGTGIYPPTNKWVYAAGTWAGTTLTAYSRTVGSSAFSTATTSSFGTFNGATSSNTFRLGDNGTSSAEPAQILDGAIGFVRIWNTALTAEQVSQNFESIRGRYGL